MAPKKKTPMTMFLEQKKKLPENRNLRMDAMARKYDQEWKQMDANARQPYVEKAKHYNGTIRGSNLITNKGTFLHEEEAEERERELYEEWRMKLVEKAVIDEADIEVLKKKGFFICSFNIMCKTQENKYLANELGLVQYTIADGIVHYEHFFIDPGPIPVGYARMSKEHSESTHKIPMTDFSQARGRERKADGSVDFEARAKKFDDIVVDIVGHLRQTRLEVDGKTPMIVFALPKQINQVKGCFKFICEESMSFRALYDDIEVLDIVVLLEFLAERGGKPRPYAACEGDLNLSTFDYSNDTNCAYHDELDCRYCALGVARRLCYMMSDVVCPIYSVTPTDKHLPPENRSDYHVVEYYPSEKLFNYQGPHSRNWHDAAGSRQGSAPKPEKEFRTPRQPPFGSVLNEKMRLPGPYNSRPDSRILNPNPSDPRSFNPNPADPRTVNRHPADPRIVSPNPADPRTVNRHPADPRTINRNPADPRTLGAGGARSLGIGRGRPRGPCN